ncbi:MAG: 2-C-methyl-D-erythritol 4-phosphate cytidylyltransferase [Pseudomonadales bacterium]|nr:2-C-methyl-D-erythritol 4-phosphate cytidylyltransferase [Pseudomonadales bacterium]
MSEIQGNPPSQILAVVPAAGIGRRMGTQMPKQYLPLYGRTVIEHAIQPLCDNTDIQQVVVSIGDGDTYWRDLSLATHPKISMVVGGIERCHSVLNALNSLQKQVAPATLVMVHDAARPCLSATDLDHLIATARQQNSGAILGSKIRDTIKRVTHGSAVIADTIDRSDLWKAQTPQMFPIGLLTAAMQESIDQNRLVTDEASAMELAGFSPVMVEGSEKNIKITRPEDLELAEYYLGQANDNAI